MSISISSDFIGTENVCTRTPDLLYICKFPDNNLYPMIRDEHNNITYESHSDGYYEDNTYSAESNHKLIKKITHYPDGREETEVFYPYK